MATIEKRTSKDGEITFRVKIRIKGNKPVTASFSRLTDAKRWAQKEEAAMREGRYFKNAEAKKRTIAEFIDRYLEHVERTNPGRITDVRSYMGWWKEQFGYLFLADLSRSLINEKTELLYNKPLKCGGKRTPATVNRYTATLRHALNIAVREWEWLEHNPMTGMKKLKEPRGRDRYLSQEELDRLLNQCQQSKARNLYPLVMLALTTGARAGELCGLRWSDIDFQRQQITLHRTKNGDKRVLYILPHVAKILKQHGQIRTIKCDLVFPAETRHNKPFDYRPSWLYALEKSQIEDFRFHDLRHTAASYMAMAGSSLIELSHFLGHKTPAMVKRYSHISEQSVANAVERMNERFLRL